MPVGMHRPMPSRWKAVWPFLAVLVVAPLLGWAVSGFLINRGADSQSGSSAATQQSAPSDLVASGPQSAPEVPQSAPAPAPAPTPEVPQSRPTETPQSTPPPVKNDAVISVLNGTGRQGLAAENAHKLTDGGFTAVRAANDDGWQAETSTVYYRDASLEATAKQVASLLGIDRVKESSDVGDQDIVALLK
ncbi:LytR C-terminal domain-containing protein [Schaalia sp. 19OD2882]|nr:LytR C-terminal domain-containing protein [Schaalia sp. 19OD2882]